MNPVTLFSSKILLPAFFILFTHTLFAQQNRTVQMDGTHLRAPLDAAPGQTVLRLCNLSPGQTYTAIVVGAAQGQAATFDFAPSQALRQAAGDVTALPGKRNALRFTAPSECVDFQLKIGSAQPATTVPFFLSVKCETCPETGIWKQEFLNRAAQVGLTTSGGGSPQSLITDVLVGGNCFQVANVSGFGNANSRGTFSNGSSSIDIDQGIVLTTGHVNVLPGPNNQQNASGGFSNNSPDDVDLAWLANGNQYDLSTIQFDFTPTASSVQFEFVFGSEEYCEYVGTMFNDVFGFFISGPGIPGNLNIGTLPGSGDAVTINNVNHVSNTSYYVNNNSNAPCTGLPVFSQANCQLDGWTTILTAQANLIPCQTYRIKLAIADVGDALFSSAVFLRANSFDAGGEVAAAPLYNGGQQSAFENCGSNFLKFSRSSGDNSQPLVINFAVDASSTATAGLDYAPLSSPVVIPAGTDEILVPVTIFGDALVEGAETIVLAVDNACSCNQSLFNFVIRDLEPLDVQLTDITICEDTTAALTPVVTGGVPPLAYLWSTGATTPGIVVDTSGAVILTATDFCGQTAADTAQVAIGSLINLTTVIEFCPGDSVVLNGTVYTQPTIVLDTLPGGPGACDTLLRYSIKQLQNPTTFDTIGLCPGASVLIGGVAYSAPSSAIDTIPGENGSCDTIVKYTLVLLENSSLTLEIQFCEGSSVTIGDSTYTQPALVQAILPGENGACDTLATYILELLPQITRTETIGLCPGQSISIGGTTYSAPGTVLQNLPGGAGACGTVVTYLLEALPQPSATEVIALCPGSTVTIGGAAYTAPNTVNLTLPGAGDACDTLATYVLELLPNPTFTDTVTFCPGDSISIGGAIYTLPGTVQDTITDPNGGCDIIGIYVLESRTPAPSEVKIVCPPSVGATIPAGNTGEIITYNEPTATTDCACPGLSVDLTSGLASGSTFPVGVTQVCYSAEDACGNSAACCFSVNIEEAEPCDIKEIGCMRWELLTVTQDALGRKTYRIRIKNSCANKLAYALFELPEGVVADAPANNSTYVAPSGRPYEVRNPNSTTFYSIRFKTLGADSLANGQSDIFKYTLPQQSSPYYIHVGVRLDPRLYFEAHMNTFKCPVGITPPNVQSSHAGLLRVFPNPSAGGVLYADLSAWAEQTVQARVFDGQGRLVRDFTTTADYAPRAIPLPESLTDGLYFLEIVSENGERQSARFVVQR